MFHQGRHTVDKPTIGCTVKRGSPVHEEIQQTMQKSLQELDKLKKIYDKLLKKIKGHAEVWQVYLQLIHQITSHD